MCVLCEQYTTIKMKININSLLNKLRCIVFILIICIELESDIMKIYPYTIYCIYCY